VGRRDAPIRPWLFRIAYNESMTQLRRRRPLSELVEELPSLADSPESAVEQRSRITRLMADLRELPERQRGALVMRELSGLSHQEVAEALGMSIGAAKQTVFEARRSLQEFDEGRAMACDDIRRMVSDGDGRSLRGRRVRAHLRDCSGCAAFAAAIPQRRADLHAFTPVLPATAAAGLLWRITGAAPGHGSGGGVGLISGATGKAVAAGASGKLLATGALIVATAAVGTGGIIHAVSQGAPPAPASSGAVPGTAGPASNSSTARGQSGATTHVSLKAQHLTRPGAHSEGAAAGRGHHGTTGSSAHGSSAGAGHVSGGPSAAGATHGHSGQAASGSSTASTRKHVGSQTGSRHRVSGKSHHHKRIRHKRPKHHTAGSSQGATGSLSGSGAGSGVSTTPGATTGTGTSGTGTGGTGAAQGPANGGAASAGSGAQHAKATLGAG
jgi:hypothetical protein